MKLGSRCNALGVDSRCCNLPRPKAVKSDWRCVGKNKCGRYFKVARVIRPAGEKGISQS